MKHITPGSVFDITPGSVFERVGVDYAGQLIFDMDTSGSQ